MNQNRMMEQVSAVFGAFMTIFYIGIGLYFIITDDLIIDKFVRSLFGFTFVFYGIYRGFRSWKKIKEAFSSSDE